MFTFYHYCPNCQKELSGEVDGELVDIIEECDNCQYKFSPSEIDALYTKAQIDEISSQIDHAQDYAQER